MSDIEKSINLTFLNSMTGGNKEKMAKYINLFLQHAPVLVSQMDSNLQNSDWASLKTASHTLKSQFSYMGAAEAQSLALQIEKNAGEQNNLDLLPAQVEQVKNIFQKACSELQDELTKL
jgi:HPt (histidine-containing phosphotransfer) domain-containing protein